MCPATETRPSEYSVFQNYLIFQPGCWKYILSHRICVDSILCFPVCVVLFLASGCFFTCMYWDGFFTYMYWLVYWPPKRNGLKSPELSMCITLSGHREITCSSNSSHFDVFGPLLACLLSSGKPPSSIQVLTSMDGLEKSFKAEFWLGNVKVLLFVFLNPRNCPFLLNIQGLESQCFIQFFRLLDCFRQEVKLSPVPSSWQETVLTLGSWFSFAIKGRNAFVPLGNVKCFWFLISLQLPQQFDSKRLNTVFHYCLVFFQAADIHFANLMYCLFWCWLVPM